MSRLKSIFQQQPKTILSFKSDTIAARLMAMGILPGATIQYIRKAPLRGAFYLKINGQCFALRKEEYNGIEFG